MGDLVIIGAGGTASHLIPVLVRMNQSDKVIHVWDADTVEVKNLERQMFEQHEVNMPKASAWEARYFDVAAHNEFIGPDNITRAIRDGDTVFICADNHHVRRLIDEHAMTLQEVAIINGGNEKSTGSCQVHLRTGGRNQTPRITYHSPEISTEDPDMSSLSCAEVAMLPGGEQTTLANMTVATFMLQGWERVRSRTVDQQKSWTKVTFDIFSGVIQTSDFRMHGDDWV